MGGDADGLAGMTDAAAPEWDRFAHWRRGSARLLLLALILILVASALVPINAGKSTVKTRNFAEVLLQPKAAERKRDDDLTLYDTAIANIAKGENYYSFIVAEHRKAHYPVRPGLAVRLPTLAYIDAWLGQAGQYAAAILLVGAVLLVWWRRLGAEPGGTARRNIAVALMFVGASTGLNRDFFVLHELWAGMLLALSFGLHRPDKGQGGKWAASLAAAALALAIRELSLPYVLLMVAMAFSRGARKEAAAWSILAAVFLAALAIHLHIIAQQVLPGDQPSPAWIELRGLSGWLSDVVLSSNIRFLPHWLAGPAVILMIFGWAGWRTSAGAFATLLYLGYGLAFMIAGRGDNFYWGAMVAPAMFIGVAFVPMAAKSLWRTASA